MKLYGYWRSSAAYRVRIALNLKNIQVEHISVHLVKNGGQQHQSEYTNMNRQELVPTFVTQDEISGETLTLTQSLAIIDYLDELHSQGSLLPASIQDKALVRSMALLVACDVHPLNNLSILQYLSNDLNIDDEAKTKWYHHWVHKGFIALEAMLEKHSGKYCFGDTVTLADLCLVPQVYNANRLKVPMEAYPNIVRVWNACNKLEAFDKALPENQPDAVVQ
ncbi:maleylacetoacetate isomerase [Parashewanella spongiae]|uniref:Maleylacetoacetate isomerase n=1 Tax=Parashewanella spongiae TaxID=342950 RepID=A0A3A6UG34_9GAMM|nr:maleylacetoacetate isomerase [Parashewanella spongiae]MCL1078204.1 maleylacetoacetate isomerase [Parashewanella spongiae]RJY16399.1 maleylacetoacetate isomerase [Parashewanella spongiae]